VASPDDGLSGVAHMDRRITLVRVGCEGGVLASSPRLATVPSGTHEGGIPVPRLSLAGAAPGGLLVCVQAVEAERATSAIAAFAALGASLRVDAAPPLSIRFSSPRLSESNSAMRDSFNARAKAIAAS
jgi:hypothetical protein